MRAATQEHVGESSGRGTRIKAAASLDSRGSLAEGVKGAGKFEGSAGDVFVTGFFADDDGLGGIHLTRRLGDDLPVESDAPCLR